MSPCHRCPEQGEAVDAGGGVRRGPGDICGHQVLLNVQQCSPHRGRRTQGQGGCWGRLRPEGHTAPRVCTLQRADCSCTARTAAALEREVWQERLKVLQAERTMWVPHGSHPEQLHGLGLGQQRGPGGQGPQAVPHLFTRGCSHLTNRAPVSQQTSVLRVLTHVTWSLPSTMQELTQSTLGTQADLGSGLD